MVFANVTDAQQVSLSQRTAPQGTNAEVLMVDAARCEKDPPCGLTSESRSKIAERLQDLARVSGHALEFRIDEVSDRVIISVRDERTGELIRQIPDATALRIAQRLESQAEGKRNVLIEDRA